MRIRGLVVGLAVALVGCTSGGEPGAAQATTEQSTEDSDAEDSDAEDDGDEPDGEEDGPFRVPDVTGLPYAEVRAELVDLGADVRREVVASPEDQHLVLDQSLAAGETVPKGATILLTVSDGSVEENAPPPAEETRAARREVTDLAGGLFCRDLRAAGFSYAEAVRYWDREGRPDRMDAAQNGTPCQTVYDSSEVSGYWGLATAVYDLPSGLFCRDLKARGYSYDDAVWYWYIEGQTNRMDASSNGIPCQTVYPRAAVDAYWWR
jgi:hypothetical protein